MATLVLTAVGGAVGGPLGAMLGGAIGQSVDRQLFAPKGRQGPRLTELAVQTSSYGTPIPKLFGTMRVAGTVIWSTDLLETRSTSRAGKGQPSTTSYSYSASFAVLLSGRPIRQVRRIWAEGKLLRGSAGDFKVATGFRLHLGGEEQAPDPLIASAEGTGLAPAHRGSAYAVFENLPLADFGNRIPSLTFEVVADETAVGAGFVAEELAEGLIEAEDSMIALDGFAASGDLRGVLDMLATASGAWFGDVGGALRMMAGAGDPVVVEDAGFAPGMSVAGRGDRSVAAIDTVPRKVSVSHYDAARDYQMGVQHSARPGAGRREVRIEMPAVLSADAARTLATSALARREVERERRTVALPWHAIGIAPGARVTIDESNGIVQPGTWRITHWSFERMVLSLELVRVARAAIAAPASSGRVVGSADVAAGPSIVHAFELPPLDDHLPSQPRLAIAAAGASPGWRSAALLISSDGGTSWSGAGRTALPATLGALATVPGSAPATLLDRVNAFEVELAEPGMVLAGADNGQLDQGVNLALVGDELLQFGRAVQIGPRLLRLDRLLRGRRGTEAAIGSQAVGDRFVLIEPDALVWIDLPLSSLGGSVRVLASGAGDLGEPAEAIATIDGRSVLPPAPAQLTTRQLPGGDVRVEWVRRSRAGWRWIDGTDAPLVEEAESYRVTVAQADGSVRTEVTAERWTIVLAAERAAGPCIVSVRQRGTHGDSPLVNILIPPL